jgi:hypothetical protein
MKGIRPTNIVPRSYWEGNGCYQAQPEHEARIELYSWRVAHGLDIWTGKQLPEAEILGLTWQEAYDIMIAHESR